MSQNELVALREYFHDAQKKIEFVSQLRNATH